MSKVCFISDPHFGHHNIIDFARPEFTDLEEMHETIVEAWNMTVNKKDVVWVLGDLAFNPWGLSQVGKLNGIKKLVLGNHDKLKPQEYCQYFSKLYGMCYYKEAVLSHMPVHTDQLKFRAKFNVHGHIHDPKGVVKDKRYVCINMDCLNTYAPITWDNIVAKYESNSYQHLFKY